MLGLPDLFSLCAGHGHRLGRDNNLIIPHCEISHTTEMCLQVLEFSHL